jgi:isoleucyl-tRNA synthetase
LEAQIYRRSFGNWIKNANDWNLSRSRYWGIPLPIWRNEEGTEEILIGSIEELYNEIENQFRPDSKKRKPKVLKLEIWKKL